MLREIAESTSGNIRALDMDSVWAVLSNCVRKSDESLGIVKKDADGTITLGLSLNIAFTHF